MLRSVLVTDMVRLIQVVIDVARVIQVVIDVARVIQVVIDVARLIQAVKRGCMGPTVFDLGRQEPFVGLRMG